MNAWVKSGATQCHPFWKSKRQTKNAIYNNALTMEVVIGLHVKIGYTQFLKYNHNI